MMWSERGGINEGKAKAPCFVSRNTGLRVCELAQHSNRFRNTLTRPREIVPTPQWVLSCSNCHKVFTHSKTNPRSATVPFDPLWPTKPDFPNGGLNLACPNCRTPAVYQRFELMYRPGRLNQLIFCSPAYIPEVDWHRR